MSEELVTSNNLGSSRLAKATPTRAAGLERLSNFTSTGLKLYTDGRNYDYGPEDRSNISALSPWIRRRLISEQEIIEKLFKTNSHGAADKYIQQVIWRTYFKGWLEQHPTVWNAYNEGVMSGLNEVSSDQSRARVYEKAITGQTGIDCFDSWATELMEHSYLHNHARLWFASIWIFTLKLPWELGANFFMKYLLDGDPASNTLSWRWVSGLHTKGKNYLATSSNIDKFTLGRFRIEAHLNEVANPLTELTEHPIQSLPRLENLPSDDFLLLVTEEDCNSVDLTGQFPVAALGLILPEKSEVFERSDAVFNFSHGAVTDGVERISSTGEVLICEEWAEPIIELARSKKVKNIVTAYTPIGPVNTKLQGIKPLLKNAGIELSFLRQKYDQTFWPHATKGFFAFKKSTNKLVQELAPYAP